MSIFKIDSTIGPYIVKIYESYATGAYSIVMLTQDLSNLKRKYPDITTPRRCRMYWPEKEHTKRGGQMKNFCFLDLLNVVVQCVQKLKEGQPKKDTTITTITVVGKLDLKQVALPVRHPTLNL